MPVNSHFSQRRLTALVLVLLLILPALAGRALAQEGAFESINLTETAGESTFPQLAFDGAGDLHLVWWDETVRRGDVLHRRRTVDGTWTPPLNLTQDFHLPFIGTLTTALHPAGYLCVFIGGAAESGQNGGFYQRCVRDGEWSRLMKATEGTPGDEYDYAPTFDLSGALHILSERRGGRIIHLYASGEAELCAGGCEEPRLLTTPDGALHALWVRQGAVSGLEHRYSNDNGQSWSAPTRLSDDAQVGAEQLFIYTAAAGPDSALHVVYVVSARPMLYTRWEADGGWSASIDLTQGQGWNGSTTVGLAVGPDGLAHLAWQGYGSSGAGGSALLYTRQQSDGTWSLPAVVLRGANSGAGPALTLDTAGGVHVAYRQVGAPPEEKTDVFYGLLARPSNTQSAPRN
jgi:hypothetical protein